jgi:hypothetical protein
VFGTPIDLTVAELALECFYPADAMTRDILQFAARRSGAPPPAANSRRTGK